MMCSIGEDEAHGDGVLPVVDQDNLEETVGYGYLVLSDAFRLTFVVDGTAGDVNRSIFPGPFPAGILQISPVIPVQFLVLRTDVAHIK